jgi:GxxExxY protein
MIDDGHALNALSERILGAACQVHTALGPGLLESAYEACLEHELRCRGLHVERQKTLPVRYQEVLVDAGYRIDLLVEDSIIVEVKSVKQIIGLHKAQLLTYLKLSGRSVGLLLNFNVERMKQGGINRLVHQFRGPRPTALNQEIR